jgi:prephenate dehydrogenase
MKQITIIGTGLIGGSLALALKKHAPGMRIIGCDREPVLKEALKLGAVDDGASTPEQAVRDSDLVVLATPVGSIIDLVERIGPLAPPNSLITDVGSTKVEIMARAKDVFGGDVAQRFLPGHPMAGKENGGIAHADAELFAGAVWLVTPYPGQDLSSGATGEYLQLLNQIGARVLPVDPVRHDRICGWVSHLPQMLSTALASTLVEELANDSDANAIGGRALREMTRIAQSPYSMWRDVALTNTKNIQAALLRVEQKLAHIRENLRTRELEEEFERANKFRKNG